MLFCRDSVPGEVPPYKFHPTAFDGAVAASTTAAVPCGAVLSTTTEGELSSPSVFTNVTVKYAVPPGRDAASNVITGAAAWGRGSITNPAPVSMNEVRASNPRR